MDTKQHNLNQLRILPPWQWPPHAGETLKAILSGATDADESDRVAAAGLAGDLVVMDDQIAELLLSIVARADEPSALRAQAAIALGPVLEQTDLDGFDFDFGDSQITEATFERIKQTLRSTFLDGVGVPKEVRRRVLEAAVRATEDWHVDAVRTAYSSGDDDWRLTAVFCMRWIRGFDKEILETLNSPNAMMHLEAVRAAGGQELVAAWPHIEGLIESKGTAKPLLLAAIEAAVVIDPKEAGTVLHQLTQSKDEEIAEAAREATQDASVFAEGEDDDENESFSNVT